MNLVRLTDLRIGLMVATAVAACGCSGGGLAPPVSTDDSLESNASSTSEAVSDCDEKERGPLTTTVGSTGQIEISDFFIGGVFYANGAIVRAKAHPECLLQTEAANPRFYPAGTLTVSSDLVGTPGGPPAPFAIDPDPFQQYAEFPDPPLFQFPDGSNVQVALAGADGFPAIPQTTLRSPVFDTINMTAPQIPSSGLLEVSSTAPLKFTWEVPSMPHKTAHARNSQSVSMRFFALGPERWGQLWCSWPIAEGRGKVPVVLLSELRRQLGGTGAIDAVLDVFSGELEEIATPTSSYVVVVTTDFATTIPRSTSATLQ